MLGRTIGTLTLLSCALALTPRVARACGGCFHPPAAQSTVVTGHRMAFAVSPTRTVLWDQIKYAGDPADFGWVLPVGPGAYIEESNDAWFESLEAVSNTQVEPPTLQCAFTQGSLRGGNGCACGAGGTDTALDAPGSAGAGGAAGKGVTVLHEGTVGPYETATLHSTDPKALASWLSSHGYEIPTDVQPVIDSYVGEGADFIALRLMPGQGVRQMTPVRVVTPGASSILPLRMVAAGTGPFVAVTLYVIGEGRYAPQNFAASAIDFSTLAWDWQTSSSNYSVLRTSALGGGDGSSWLTTWAQPKGLSRQTLEPSSQQPVLFQLAGSGAGYYGTGYTTLAELYFAQAAQNDSLPPSQGCTLVGPLLSGADLVDEASSSQLACGGYSDLQAAMIGMHPKDVWVTRLEANLPHAALANDLTLKAADAQVALDAWHVAEHSVNPPCVEKGTAAADIADTRGLSRAGFGAAVLAALLGRRALRRKRC